MLKWNAQGPLLLFAVHEQARNRVELPADVEANGTDRRVVAQTRPHVVAQVVQVEVPRVGPDVAAVEEQHGGEVADEREPDLGREVHEAVAADRVAPRR